MKSKAPIAIFGLVLTLGVAFFFLNGADLQGRFGTFKSPVIALSDSSPSGARSVSSNDQVMIIDMKAIATDSYIAKGKTFELSFATDADFDALAHLDPVYLKQGATIIAEGLINKLSDSQAEASLELASPISIAAGDTETYSVTMNTSHVLSTTTGEDESLDITFEFLGKSILGNTLTY